MKLQAIIVDDEHLARKGLALRLKNISDIEVAGEYGNAQQAIQAVEQLQPDLVFLDIQMPETSGIEVVEKLLQLNLNKLPEIIFVTAYDQFAVKAFELHALDYLLKPVEQDRLQQAINRCQQRQNEVRANNYNEQLLAFLQHATGHNIEQVKAKLASGELHNSKSFSEYLSIKDGANITRVLMHKIDWIEAAGDYMCVHAEGKTHIMRTTMKELEDILNPQLFQRIHRSTIVNTKKVQQLRSHINGEYHLVLTGGQELKLSRSYKQKIKLFL